MFKTVISTIIMLFLLHLFPGSLSACSTFKFQKGGELFYGHVLDEPGKDMPGMIYINKRGVFKTGRSFIEMFTEERPEKIYKEYIKSSELCWISRFGSITFSPWGRDFPDGGINEAGLFIWEMSLSGTEYPKNEKLPKLIQMNWMQYILDNFCTLDEALTAAYDIEITGMHWHYFLGDEQGNCATLEFIDGEVVIHRGEKMPVPGLFNQTYDREIEFLQFFKGFGGFYEPDLNDNRVPRFVKTAVMLRDYDPAKHDALEYSKSLLYEVGNKPYKWGILIDIVRKKIYFNTESNQEWKSFSCRDIDFSNNDPVMTLNIDQPEGGDVSTRFHPQQDSEVEALLMAFGLSDNFFQYFGITREKFAERFSTAYHDAEKQERHYFSGVWKGESDEADEKGEREQLTLELKADGSNVSGSINFRDENYPIQHIHLIDKKLEFTFRTKMGTVIAVKSQINANTLDSQVRWDGGLLGRFLLERQ